jgi:hypothetical protein
MSKRIAHGLLQAAAGWLYVFAAQHGAQAPIGCNKADAVLLGQKLFLVILLVEFLKHLRNRQFHATKIARGIVGSVGREPSRQGYGSQVKSIQKKSPNSWGFRLPKT